MRKNMCVLSAAAALLMLLSSTYATRGQEKTRVTGTYTNMRYIPEAGDVVGEELLIVRISTGYQGAFQDAEGVPGPLVVVNITITGSRISFNLPPGAGFVPPARFEGTIKDSVIRGNYFSNGQIIGPDVVLKRGKSYWD